MPKQKTVQVKLTEQDQKGYSNSFMVIHDQVLMPWVCEELMEMFDKLPIVEVEETHQQSFTTVDPEMQDQNHRYEHQDRIHGNIYPGTEEFTNIPSTVSKVVFLGGEPLMTNIHRRFLESFDTLEDLEVEYFTNGMHKLVEEDYILLNECKQIGRAHV